MTAQCVKRVTCIISGAAIAFAAMVDDAGSSAQRIRIGLTGLAFAFLLVLLGSAITRSGAGNHAGNAAAQAKADSEPNEPLAELGVAPGAADSASNSGSNRQ